ncbi:DegQ family serine endoprotease [Gellertiella hungarica]|uniref:Do/DeqQ family serine protease n=1 Tax=Gellertiella hungarica TaxID=1572859 RepID=A0A7W6J5B3_9HYPH|nr:Do/DeqQ family serine protease [Gellertiella hungarica]
MIFNRSRVLGLVLVASLLPAAGMRAEETKTVPQSAAEMQLSFAPLVKQTSNSVVNVYAERIVQRRSPVFDDPFFEQFFGQRMPNRTEKQSSLGSGVIATADGMVITNNHVIEGADDIKVALADGREYPCEVVMKDERVDLAVLRIKSRDRFAALTIGNSDQVEVGDLVLAIGNPFGVGQTVTSGIVSALARNQVVKSEFGFFIQTDAAINPGNSGGALMNMKGELIGINTAIFSRGGGSNGVGFAIPANLVKAFLNAAERGATSFERPYIGATFEPVTSEVASALGLTRARGALIVKVVDGGPAAKAGLKPGEVITAVNGIEVEHPDALGYRLATAGLGTSVTLEVMDNGEKSAVKLSLAGPPETQPRDERLLKGNNPLAGALVANLSPRLADELHLPSDLKGVIILRIKGGSPADDVGFRPSDIVLSLNGTAIDSTATLEAQLGQDQGFWQVEINRGGQIFRQIFR